MPNRCYNPSPAEIEEQTAKIREGWSDAERLKRWNGPLPQLRLPGMQYDNRIDRETVSAFINGH